MTINSRGVGIPMLRVRPFLARGMVVSLKDVSGRANEVVSIVAIGAATARRIHSGGGSG